VEKGLPEAAHETPEDTPPVRLKPGERGMLLTC